MDKYGQQRNTNQDNKHFLVYIFKKQRSRTVIENIPL